MFAILFYGGIILAFIVIWTIYRCAKANRTFCKTTISARWQWLYKWRYLVALLLVPLLLPGYPVVVDGEHYQIIGFPLMAAAFDSNNTDFVSPFTGLFFLIDVVIVYFSIHIILCLLQRWAGRKNDI